MNLIIPMAGMGKRMRPHTLTVPKPLVPVAGKPIVQWLIEDIVTLAKDKIDNIAFIIGDFGKEVENQLLDIAQKVGSKGTICYQNEALGTAHAIHCASQFLENEVIVAFADTLFSAEFNLDKTADGVIWVHKVADPSAFGVVTLNADNKIDRFVEKPKDFISDLAIIGIYFFKNGNSLLNEINYLLQNNIMEKGEYQLTNALDNMKNKGMTFVPGEVAEWWDCGNKNATVNTNQRVLETKKIFFNNSNVKLVGNSIIHEPCFIGEGVIIDNSEIGPHVAIGKNTAVLNSKISNSIIQNNSTLKNVTMYNSMIGNEVTIDGLSNEYSIGDYSTKM